MRFFNLSSLKNLVLLSLTALLFFSCAPKKEVEKKPNVIFIFPDQFRQFSLGFWSQGDNSKHIPGEGDPVKTPVLDKFANEGVVFNRAMSNFPLCSPYRGMFLTGRYPHENGLTTNCRSDRDIGIINDGKGIADVFASAGYETAYFGKCHWHKTEPVFDKEGTYHGTTEAPGGEFINRYDTYVPSGAPRLGFNYFFQTLRDTHMDPLCYSNDPKVVEGRNDGELYQPKIFSAKLESDVIIDYLDNTRSQRDTDKPFFMVWALNPPHNPWTEESTDMKFYPQYTENGKANLDNLLKRENADKEVGDYAAYYFANVSAVDYYIGQVLDKLEEIGEADNTIIVFSSDHGEMLGSHGHQGKPYPEMEAFNIPLIVKWGKKLKHRVEDLMISVPDMMPTILGLARIGDAIPETVQGTDYASVIENPETATVEKPRVALYIDFNSRGFYSGDYTFVVKQKDGKLLEAYMYDNTVDPYQIKSVSYEDMDAAQLREFKATLNKLLKDTNDPWYTNGVCKEFLSE